MPGSKKGERRGNARKRAAKPPGSYAQPKNSRTHETPSEIMRDALSKRGPQCLTPVVIERRIQISRMILGHSGTVEDTTPKEALLLGMQHNLQAYRDWIEMIEQWSQMPVTAETTYWIDYAEKEAERLLDKMGEFAFKVAGFIHPKLQAIATTQNLGENPVTALQTLMDEIDELERERPVPIEHKTKIG